MVERDNFFRWLQGLPEPTEDELKLQRRMWSASTATAMYHEFSSIILCRMAYIVMQPHRFIFNLGYTTAGVDHSGMTSVGLLLTSMFLELCFEFVVDSVTLQVEAGHGEQGKEEWRHRYHEGDRTDLPTTMHSSPRQASEWQRFGKCGE